MKLPNLTREEFCLFNVHSQICLLDMHGTLITAKIVNGEIQISVYLIYEYYIRVIKELPSYRVIEVVPIANMREFSTYLGLDSYGTQYGIQV